MSEDVKRPRGRPRKNLAPAVEAKAEPKQLKMKAAPNWDSIDPDAEDTPDRLKINPALIPEGMSAQWVTDSVLGQGVPQHRSDFERKGWTPVHPTDFDGQFEGMFTARGHQGEIKVDGLVLMMRPKELTERSKRADNIKAREQVQIKEQSLRGGDLPVSLDSRHPSALGTNRISKTMERIQVPE